jgi:hypothetical protein
MKKQVFSALFILTCFISVPNVANAGIAESSHDFTASGPMMFYGDNDEVCIYCHTPHGAAGPDRFGNTVPLWNRTLNETATFTMYNSPTLDATMPADNKPKGYSLLCLSCHDGVTSIGNVINNSGTSASISMNPPYDPINYPGSSYPDYKNPVIGTDLSNDHPVSFIYDNALVDLEKSRNNNVQGLQYPASIDSRLKLYGNAKNLLECTTCHDPHEEGGTTNSAPFLRMANTDSGMCRSCHLK